MMEFWEALAFNPLLLAAVFAGLAASIVSGIIGSYVVVKRIVFISGSISHAVLSGIGLSLWLERSRGIAVLSTMHGALVAAVFSALLLGWIRAHYRQREDSVIAALWSVGMAIGILFISQTPGYNVELTNFLIGNILWVTPEDLATLLVMDVTVLAVVMLLYNKFLVVCFDEDQARLQGVNVNSLYLLLLVLTSVSIVLLIQVVGVILLMTMLTIPAAIANNFTTKLSSMMIAAVVLSAIFCVVGMNLAYALNWPGGATIALVAGVVYVASMLLPCRK